MPKQVGPAHVLPPTPEDETDMAQLQPGRGREKSIQALDKANKNNGIVGDVVDTRVSPSSSLVLSRFEFEPGKGNEGTKVLMVEWDNSADSVKLTARGMSEESNSDSARQGRETTPENDWVVTWEGKESHNVLVASDDAVGLDSTVRRMYFLLPPGATIPSLVRITRGSRVCVSVDGGSDGEVGAADLWTKPMPAIYPASLGSDACHAGGRGVLHTLWAKQRLGSLAAEIEAEMKANSESIGLQIALQEHGWVSDHFGIEDSSGLRVSSPFLPSPASPASSRFSMPRSPISGKLGEKLRGLRLVTSPAELAAALQVKTAASSTGAASGTQPARATGEPVPVSVDTRLGLRTSIEPHIFVNNSLDAVISDSQTVHSTAGIDDNAMDAEDELFALPMSPRSPEMARSPFSLL